jgi:hypothetical protein
LTTNAPDCTARLEIFHPSRKIINEAIEKIMGTPTIPPPASASEPAAGFTPYLGDKRLQSTEEAALVQAATAINEALPALAAAYAANETSSVHDQHLVPSHYTSLIKRYIADQPLRSAFLAAAAGALGMLLIRFQLTKSTGSKKWMRIR